MPDEQDELTVAFFRRTQYLVDSELGAVAVGGRELVQTELEDVAQTRGWEVVTKEELFSRWPVWKQTEDRLLQRLRDQGSS
jgi:hypothetical protein